MMTATEIARLQQAGSSGISDAMERLALPRSVITGFQCSASAGVVVGRALTIRQAPKRAAARHDQRLVRHGEVVTEQATAGDFVVLDAAGRTDIAGWGENHSRRCKDRGVAGVLVNGATRDLAAIRSLGLPVYHLGTSPVSSRWDQETVEVNGPVVVAGVQVHAGDILVGDGDGLIVIDPALLPRILGELR